MPSVCTTLTKTKSCPCKPDYVFGSSGSFNNHFKTLHHKAYEIGLEQGRKETHNQNNNDLLLEVLHLRRENARLVNKCNNLTKILHEEDID